MVDDRQEHDEDDRPTFSDASSEARYFRALAKDRQDELAELRSIFEELQLSSKELEIEMDKDIALHEKREAELRTELERLRSEMDSHKHRHQTALKEHSTTLSHMQRELESLRASEKTLRNRMRDMELDNDDLEKNERATASTLGDMEIRYNKSIERTALLEEELVRKAQLEEELQRVRDQLRETFEEVEYLRSHPVEPSTEIDAPNASGQQGPNDSNLDMEVLLDDLTDDPPQDRRSAAHVPPPDIDSADESSFGRPAYGPYQSRIAMIKASPSKIPLRSGLRQSLGHTSEASAALQQSSTALSRSSHIHDLSKLAASRKSGSPTTLRNSRTTTMASDAQHLIARVKNMKKNLNTRHEGVMSGSAIPRSNSSKGLQAARGNDSMTAQIAAWGPAVQRNTVQRNNATSLQNSTPLSTRLGQVPMFSPSAGLGQPTLPQSSRSVSRLSNTRSNNSRPSTPSMQVRKSSPLPGTQARENGMRESPSGTAKLTRRASAGLPLPANNYSSGRPRKVSAYGSAVLPHSVAAGSMQRTLGGPDKTVVPKWR